MQRTAEHEWISNGWFLTVAGLLILIAAARLAPHLNDALWQDEAHAALTFFTQPFAYSFAHYPLPNHHPLFDAVMALWWDRGDGEQITRALPALIVLGSLVALVRVAQRLLGRSAALLALVLFSSATVTAHFALQLRGYGFSWLPVICLLWATHALVTHVSVMRSLCYLILSAITCAIVPTNGVLAAAIAVWGLLMTGQAPGTGRRHVLCGLLLAGPALGALVYVPVAGEISALAKIAWNPLARPSVLWHVLTAFSADFALVLPLAVFGGLRMLRARASALRPASDWTVLSLLVVTVGSIVVTLMVLPNPPFPRNFVPWLPLWCLALAGLVVRGASMAGRGVSHAGLLLALAASGFSVYLSQKLDWCQVSLFGAPAEQNLCRSFYQQGYAPAATLQWLLQHVTARNSEVVVSDEGMSLIYLIRNYDINLPFNLSNFKAWPEAMKQRQFPIEALYVVSDKPIEWLRAGLSAGSPAGQYREVHTTGVFRIYEVSR